jgi:hypothetical protein
MTRTRFIVRVELPASKRPRGEEQANWLAHLSDVYSAEIIGGGLSDDDIPQPGAIERARDAIRELLDCIDNSGATDFGDLRKLRSNGRSQWVSAIKAARLALKEIKP